MNQDIMSAVLLPGILAFMMVGMGSSLTLADFKRLQRLPKPLIVGLVSQMLLLPLLGWLIIEIFSLSSLYAVGVMVLCLCPGGAGSNLLVLIAGADRALSVSLTALSNLILIFTLPILINVALRYYLQVDTVLQLPVLKTLFTTACITLFPVCLGMWLRIRWPLQAERWQDVLRKASTVLLVFLMLGMAVKHRAVIMSAAYDLGPAIATLNVGATLLGCIAALILRLPTPQIVTIAIETGFQNAALAIVITATFLSPLQASHGLGVALPPVFYGGMMFVGAFMVVGLTRLAMKRES